MSEGQSDQKSLTAETQIIGKLFETPVTIRGYTWLPLTQLVMWGIMTHVSKRKRPEEGFSRHITEGALTSSAILGSEWCHNLAHVFIAEWIGKPMDELQIQFGMPRCRYEDLNDREVSPRQHVIRSLGGPLINLLMIPLTTLAKFLTKTDTIARETAKAALQTNVFLSVVSLLPIPGIDGGPIVKWSLVEKGYEIEEADQMVQRVNGPLSLILGFFSSWAFLNKKNFAGIFSALLALISLAVFTGKLKEDEIAF
jgi:hypothetical protein